MPPTILGVDIEAGAILTYNQVEGRRVQSLVEHLNRHTRPILKVEEDPEYQIAFGTEGQRFDFDYVNCEVWRAWMPGFLAKDPFYVASLIDVTAPAAISQAISTSAEDYYVFLNGGAAYSGTGNGAVWAVMGGSSIPAAQRNFGFLVLAADPGNAANIPITVDRIKMTLPKVGGGNYERWITMPLGYELPPGSLLVYDWYGNCFTSWKMDKASFLSCWTIQPDLVPTAGEGSDRFDTGAVVNELEMVKAHGRYVVNALDVNFARGDELDHLADVYFATGRRSGETDLELIDRVIAKVAGDKCTPYAVAQTLLKFSPWVIISEGMRGYGAYGRSFYRSMWFGTATGVPYSDYVLPAFYSSKRSGLFFARIRIESNAVTTDPITGAFIYRLIDEILMGGCDFELTLV